MFRAKLYSFIYEIYPHPRRGCPGGRGLARTNRRQEQDGEYARLVKEWTTRPEFMSPLVDHLPKAAGIPTPKDVLGYYVGAPKKLTHVADLLRYYRALAEASKRVKILPAGRTDEGREQVIVVDQRRKHHPQSGHLQGLPGEAGRPARD